MRLNVNRKLSLFFSPHWSLVALKRAVQQLILIKNPLPVSKVKKVISSKILSLMMSENENNIKVKIIKVCQ